MKQRLAPQTLILFLTALLGAACSAQSVSRSPSAIEEEQIQYQPPPFIPGTGSTSGGSGSGGSGSGGSGSAGSGSSEGSSGGTGLPPISMRVGSIGYTAVTVEVDVRAVLKVRFAPGIQDEVVQGTGYSPAYSRLGVYIQVGTKTQATEMLSNGLLDRNPQKSSIIDFSGAFTPSCDPSDDTCHQPVAIKVFKPNNDYFCMNFGMYCPWANLYDTHPWHGTLFIQTDDTDPL